MLREMAEQIGDMVIKEWEGVNRGMKEMQIKEMVSQEGYMVNVMMVGEMKTRMVMGMMVREMVGTKWEMMKTMLTGMEVNMLVRVYSKMGNMVVLVKMEMGKYMVKMMGASVWERFMMWQGKVEDMLKEVWDRVGVMMKCGVL